MGGLPPPPPGVTFEPPPPPGVTFAPEPPTPSVGDVVKGIGGMVGGALVGSEGVEAAKHAVSTPETALRTIPPVALQTAGTVGGAALGGEPGAAAGGAVASVLSDFYERFLNHMYGVPNAPLSLGHEAVNAGIGAIASEVPPAAEALTGLRGARQLAESAAQDAGTSNVELGQAQTKIQQGLDAKRQDVLAKGAVRDTAAAAKQSDLVQKTLQSADEAKTKVETALDANRQKLSAEIQKSLEKQRPNVAEQVGTEKIQGMLGKTPADLAQQEATPDTASFAASRAAALGPVFQGAQQYHKQVGQLFEPYIGPHAQEAITGEGLDSLNNTIAGIKQQALERGQNLNDTDLNKVFGRLEEATKPPDAVNLADIMKGKGGKDGALQLSNADWERLQNAQEGKQTNPLTVGEAWGLRSRLGQVLAKSNNAAVRLAAHDSMDAITDLMPDIPDSVRQQYATERAQFPRTLMRQVATARNPGEVGQAIFGTPTSPEPAQIALNVIRRANTPEAKTGLQSAFADNWLSKPHSPDDIGRYNPAVIKELYGDSANDVFSILGHEGTVNSASWEKLIASSPQAKTAFDGAYKQAITSQAALNLRQAVGEGQRALQEMPDRYAVVQKALQSANTDVERAAILKSELNKVQPTEKQAETLAQQPQNPRQAAVDALTGKGPTPARMERYAAHRLAFDALVGVTTGAGVLAKHPELAVAGGALLGGRAALRYALSQPQIAQQYVRMLRLGATPTNAVGMGRFLGALTTSAALTAVKENPDMGLGQAAQP